jgi:uncharacterized cofD-like protein
LAIYGRIYPSTSQNVGLRAVMQDGSIVEGETKISRSRKRIHRLELTQGRVKPLRDALDAIAGADLITMGPGSLYTSVIPNLLVDGIGAALRKSKAAKAYFANLMWQPWETMSYSAADHAQAIHDHGGKGTIERVILNTTPLAASQRRRYASEKVYPVELDTPRLLEMGLEVVGRPLLFKGPKVRHDPEAIARIAMELAAESRTRRTKSQR